MATTSERLIVRSDSNKGNAPVAAGDKIPGGTLCFSNAAGYATHVIDGGANKLLGVAHETGDNTGGANGDLNVDFWRESQFQFPVSGGVTQADIGKKVYAVDNDTLSLTATNQVYVGTITEIVSATDVMVSLDPNAV